ncbi:MAG: lytic transglycosylase domain-containing protein [candidate division KSB1 bacterium]|nr:lytic transglycosylase domain-containing protein [candidate division KSB1 bacterium]MDZ7303760.1 lytic transglycosylase domain-containing protein [candidate division KSB1 bacterium]MDZ7313019.1 lytic transglycosylase domain-containing protein [candidate division KSB1 bacterium]
MKHKQLATSFEGSLETPPSHQASFAHNKAFSNFPHQRTNRRKFFRAIMAGAPPAGTAASNLLRPRQGKILLIVTLVIIICISMISFAFRFYTIDHGTDKVADLTRTLNHLKAAMTVDAVRQQQLQKVMALISRYNPEMPSEKKYAIADEIYKMCIKYPNLNIDLICATITHESAMTWRPDIRSQAGAMGLMQIMPATGVVLAADEGIPWTSPEKILYNPILNIRLGCRYLSNLISLYELDGGLAAYNGGEKRAAIWLANGKNDRMLWAETRDYIPAVLKLYQEFRN